MREKFITTLVALLMITSVVAPIAGVAGASVPSGMVGVPDSNVGPLDHANGAGPPGDVHLPSSVPTDAAAWDVLASKHAGDLEVTIGETSSGSPALVFSDETNHAGREVAVDASTLADTVGERPELAYGLHSSGEEWSSAIRYEDGKAIFEIPKFSSNTVTFEGEMVISGSPSSDGSQYSYDLGSDNVDNFTIDVTGVMNHVWDNESGALPLSTGSTDSNTTSPAGTHDPVGESVNGQPVLSVTGGMVKFTHYESSNGKERLFGKFGGDPIHSEHRFDDPPDTITSLSWAHHETGDYNGTVDIYIVEEQPDEVYGEGTLVAADVDPDTAVGDVALDSPYNVSTTGSVTVEFVSNTVETSGDDYIEANVDSAPSTTYFTREEGGTSTSYSYAASMHLESEPRDVGVDTDAGTSATFGNLADGETVTTEFNITTAATSLTWSGYGGTIDYALEMQERTLTSDPTIEVNGETTSYTGSLSEGETTALTTNTSWIETNGTNLVNVSVGDGTLSSDAPTPQVGLDYSHTAADNQEVAYDSEAYSERYNVSKKFASDQSGATLTVPFASTVLEMRTLEVRTNESGGWSTVASADYTLSGTELTVQLGDVTAGTVKEVRAVGTKVQVSNGAISVTDATPLGEDLATKILIESYSDGFEIEVNETEYNDALHYTYSESWTNAQSYASVQADGSQSLRLPKAGAGGEARIGTIPLEVQPSGGRYDVRVSSAGDEPELDVRSSSTASEADLVWKATDDGHTYQLYSLTEDEEVTRDTAQSPVTLTHDAVSELLVIYDLGSGGGGGGGGGPTTSGQSPTDAIPLLLAAVAGLTGMFLVVRRFGGDDSISGLTVFVAGALIIGVLAIQALAPRVLAQSIGAAIENSFALILIMVGAVAIMWLRSRQDNVSINLRGNK